MSEFDVNNNREKNLKENDIENQYYEGGFNRKSEFINVEKYEIKESTRKKKGLLGKKIIAYMLAGVLIASIGGGVGSYATYSVLSSSKTNENKLEEHVNKSYSDENIKINKSNELSREVITIPEIVETVSPAVVAVSTKEVSRQSVWGYSTPPREGLGSGVIFNEEGYILTNFHVVDNIVSNRGSLTVIFNTGKEVNAKVVNYDEEYDIAVLKITEDVEIPGVANFGDSDELRQGEQVVAIGNPVGKELLGTVTSGIVSAINRSIGERDIKFIQTDAAISPGNSGGPLVNTKGEVIGINTEKRVGNGVEGLGFAIPINQIVPLLDELVTPALKIGIGGRIVTPELAKEYNIPEGFYVNELSEFGPAEKSGMRIGDIITEIDGIKIKSMEDIDSVKAKHKAGDIVNVIVDRDGEKKSLKLKLGELN
ncbi:S1C family serine protease [Oceanirhabdus sp. W0125-5]|uniref:S1C family serine protease n=1 Tax=Oceanirhabdus sp. W0125-5 TaxID=2999116 RepID=UPI0022F2DA8D|nr:trypsin-like peptidase domain-containing protein [Oceanirhabdus sp. W0125-5]WBW94761.1 trypsin-like peptidase domain-containing protein [Oceanirhabdus sp. W0125-5]